MGTSLPIQDRLRASSVSRWHIVRTVNHQSVAEHSFNVAMIAMEIGNRLGYQNWREKIAVAALEHDLDEIHAGDIPTPAKPQDKVWMYDAWSIGKIIKVADVMEALWFITQNKVGRHGAEVHDYVYAMYVQILGALDESSRKVVAEVKYDIDYGDFYESRRAKILERVEDRPSFDGNGEPS